MSSQSSIKTSTIVALSVGTVVTGLLAYAVYFDNKRRNDPEFRKALKKESKRTQRAAKEEAEHHGAEQKKLIREAVAAANEEGFPKDPEEVEAYFMQEVAQGEAMVQKGMIHRMQPERYDADLKQAQTASRPRCASTAR
jgi:import receptor subunit TOM20